tara:strand:- start:3901 stop:4467 length:567 start_codon:yes stop_codon:yes gene_type:complete
MSKFEEFDKRFGKLPLLKDVSETDVKKEEEPNVLASFVAIILQVLFTGPNRNWTNPLSVIALGFLFLIINLYFLFNLDLSESFFGYLGFERGTLKFMTGLACIGFIVQCVRGVWIIGGWNQHPVEGYQYRNIPYSGHVSSSSRPYGTTDSNKLPDAIGETHSWMNSKMQSMTNNQRESYLRDFYGGKK